ncbi:2204_t:CDS:1, partial [Acaulospora morrowiae]
VVLIFACLGYIMFQRNSRKNKGTRLEETTSINSENVIPIAYIPPNTPKTPENIYQEANASQNTLIDITDDTSCEVGTILQATKTSPVTTTANTATVVTATRVKPALVRINTIKSVNTTANSIRSGISTSPDPLSVDKSSLNTPSVLSVQNSPETTSIIVGNDNTMNEVPRIDIERSSGESSRPSTRAAPSSRQHLNSPFLDPIEGRQSFGLFGSDEVYNTDPTTPQLQRESTVSSNSTNGRSTMFSDEGDGEITIFWGGNDEPFMPTAGTKEKEINPKIEDPNKNVTNTKEENI